MDGKLKTTRRQLTMEHSDHLELIRDAEQHGAAISRKIVQIAFDLAAHLQQLERRGVGEELAVREILALREEYDRNRAVQRILREYSTIIVDNPDPAEEEEEEDA